MVRKAISWKPKNCKSLTIKNLRHTDYSGISVKEETGYAEIDVYYYTTENEGEIKA